MIKTPSFALKIAAMGLALVGLIIILGIPAQPVNPTMPVLPTQMILPSATEPPQNVPISSTDVSKPSALPPTALPPEFAAVALKPTNSIATPTIQPSLPPENDSRPILEPLPEQPVPHQVTIQFAVNVSPEEQRAYIDSLGGQIETNIAPLNTVVIRLPDGANTLPPSPLVIQTEPDYYVRAQQSTPNDPFYNQQWALPVIRAAEAWPLLPANTPEIVVAVIDSGICATHQDLVGRILPGYDYVQEDDTPQDEYGHGCQVAGVIAANANNSIGVAGVAPNTMVMPLRVLDALGYGTTSNVAAAITYATDHGAKIINLSLGGANPSTVMQNAINYAVSQGVLVIAAAGNTGGTAQPGVLYPAAYPNVVAVASVDQNLQISSFSSYGPQVDLLAPGRNIMTTIINGSYGYATGTSFAAPQVTGIAALEMAQGRTLTQDGGIAKVYIPKPEPTDTWAVILDEGSDPNTVAAQLHYENLGQIGTLENTYLFRVINSDLSVQSAQNTSSTFQTSSQVLWFEQQYAQQYYTRTPNDEPLYTLNQSEQWHLRNGIGALSLNMPQSWVDGTTTGSGVQIAIVDDGLQYTHPDLAPNFNLANNASTGSCDFNDTTPAFSAECNEFDPAADTVGACGSAADCHGTAAAGVAAAADNPVPTYPGDWDFCGVGVAYGAQLSGIRILSAHNTAAQRAAALTYRYDVNDIYNNSWGPLDSGIELGVLDPLIRDSLTDGITNGRGGLGSIYVWAAGNGRANGDNINADGYANSRYVIAVGAIDYLGRFASYSEPGAAMLVTAPSNGIGRGISTTDLMGRDGYNTNGTNDYSFFATDNENYSCTKTFTGTSATAPMVSGVVALMLQANPTLTWRDVQHILVKTARKVDNDNDDENSDWQVNGAGRDISHNYGFGLVDASAAVAAAQTWVNVGPEIEAQTAVVNVNQSVPDNNTTGVTSSVTLDANLYIEHVEVIFNASHPSRGQLEVILTSPDGTQSRLMEQRIKDESGAGYINWSFSSVRHWGEHSAGTWTLKVNDTKTGQVGNFQNWKLIVYGTDAPPKQPTPIAPIDNVNGDPAIITALPWSDVMLRWDMTDVYADQVELQLDTVNPPVTLYELAGDANSDNHQLALGTYYWRVRVVDDDPNTLEPDWAEIPVQTFTVATSASVAPERNYFITATPTITWKQVSWSSGYQVEISTSPTFAAGATVYLTPADTPISAGETSFVVTDPVLLPDGLTEGVYYWRMRARKADGINWSATWSATDTIIVDLP